MSDMDDYTFADPTEAASHPGQDRELYWLLSNACELASVIALVWVVMRALI